MKTLLPSLLLTCLPVMAGTPAPLPAAPAPDSGWQFRAAPYLWAQSLDGTEGVHGLAGDVNVDFSDIASDLDFAFMAAFEARHGRWSVMADVNYAETSDAFEPASGLLSDGDFKMQQFLGNVTLNYCVMENASSSVILYAGTRLNWIDLDLSLTGPGGVDRSRSGDDFWADAIAGIRFQTRLGGPWFLRASGDIGGGESDLTWQAMALVGYNVSESFSVGLGYRGIGTDYQNGGTTYDITAHGPVLGVEWRW